MKNLMRQSGFTLVELIMVIVIMGIIAGMVSVFMKSPIDAYFASGRRAAMTDVADTVVRRMARDIQRALPNSIRTPTTTPANQCVEFIPTKTGGRYRADDTAAGLSFATLDGSFNMLGDNNALPADQQIGRGDWIVVYNLGIPGAEAYDESTNNRTQVSATAPVPLSVSSAPETTIPINSKQFPLASGSNRFHVVPNGENVVSYMCSSGNLHRTASTFTFAASHSCPDIGPIVASNVNCASTTFNYSADFDLRRNALVSMVLTIQDSSGETVSLQHEVHVSNTP